LLITIIFNHDDQCYTDHTIKYFKEEAMKKAKKTVIIIAAAVLGLSQLAGCSSAPKETAPAATTAQTSSFPTEDITLRFSWWGNDDRHERTLEVIKMYQELHPNVTIEPEYRGKSEREKVATELGSGTCADIVQLNPPWMGDFTTNGDFFVDLSAYAGQMDLAGFDQKLLAEYCYYNDVLITLPSGINARTYLVNKTKLAELGIDCDMTTEWTWDSLYETGQKLHAENPDLYFLNADKVDMTEFVLRPYLIQKTGQQIITDDYQMGFTREDLVEALSFIGKLYDGQVVLPASEGNTFLNSVWTNPDWINGKLMTELSWTSLIAGVTGDMADEYAITTLPVAKDAVDSAIVVKPSQLLAVTKTCKYPEVAADFLNFFLTDAKAGEVLADTRGIPPYEAVQNVCKDSGILDANVIIATQYAQDHAGLYENTNSTNAEITTVLNDAVEIVSYDSSKVDEAVDQAMALIEDILSTLQ